MPLAPVQVLFVEDQPAVAAVVQLELEQAGLAITSVRNGKECLALARGKKFDLILLDQLLPEMDGIETCRQLKKDPALQAIPVIFLTAYPNRHHEAEARKIGAADYVRKGCTEPALAERILAQVGRAKAPAAPPSEKAVPEKPQRLMPSWLKSLIERP